MMDIDYFEAIDINQFMPMEFDSVVDGDDSNELDWEDILDEDRDSEYRVIISAATSMFPIPRYYY
jgi:hypothetical protein